jgi:serine/threonine-protein kinase RsbW
MTGEYSLEGLAVPETLDRLHALLEQVGQDHPALPADTLMMFETAVIEIAGNVVKHGRPQGKVLYTFRLRVLPDRMESMLCDSGDAVAELPESGAMPDALQEQGRGLMLAEAALDELRYERVDGRNRWTMVRYRT